ncbi:MAG: hypothetical protein QXG86_02350 [Candidatus Woesearchaeota archaeon]
MVTKIIMKNKFLFINILTIWVIFLSPQVFGLALNYSNTNIDSQHADVYISVLKYEPFPVAPGRYFNLWLKIENKGDIEAPDLMFKIKPEYPFFLDINENPERKIGKLESHQSAVINYKVRVDEKAVEGDSFLHYEYKTAPNKNAVENTIAIRVQTPKPVLSVLSVKTEPSKIAPGEKSEISIELANTGYSPLWDINVNLGVYIPITTTTTTYQELPFTPLGEGNQKTIYNLIAGEKKIIKFVIMADPDAESKPYKIPLQITYYDALGNNYSITPIAGVVVGSEPEVYTLIETNDVYKKGQLAELPIKFVNKGTGDIKFMNVKLKNSEYYTIVSSDTYYIGKIDSDDYDTAVFKIIIKKIKDKQVEIPIEYTYKDSNNQNYFKNETLILKIYTASELGKGSNNSGFIIVSAIVLIAVIYWRYKKWVGKKRKTS